MLPMTYIPCPASQPGIIIYLHDNAVHAGLRHKTIYEHHATSVKGMRSLEGMSKLLHEVIGLDLRLALKPNIYASSGIEDSLFLSTL